MIAVDTNVLVRILAEDPGQPAQVEAARALASRAKQVFVPLVVQVETVWVLSHPAGPALPEILEQAQHVDLPGLDRERVIDLKMDGTRDEELYRDTWSRTPWGRSGWRPIRIRR